MGRPNDTRTSANIDDVRNIKNFVIRFEGNHPALIDHMTAQLEILSQNIRTDGVHL